MIGKSLSDGRKEFKCNIKDSIANISYIIKENRQA